MKDKFTTNSEKDLLDILLDKDNKDPILLCDENGKQISFEQVCIVPMNNNESLYVILKPIDKIDGIADDEAVVFLVDQDKRGNTILRVEKNESIAIEVFDKYYDLLEKSRNASVQQSHNDEDVVEAEEAEEEEDEEEEEMDEVDVANEDNEVLELSNDSLAQVETSDIAEEPLTDGKEEYVSPIDITKVFKVVRRINKYCKEIDRLEADNQTQFQNEKKSIEAQVADLISEMQKKYSGFKKTHFDSLKAKINDIADLLIRDYGGESLGYCGLDDSEAMMDFACVENELHSVISRLNSAIDGLNKVNFDELVPPVKIEVKSETFVTYNVVNGNKTNVKEHDYREKPVSAIADPKPILGMVREILPLCSKALALIDRLVLIYDRQFDIEKFNSYVRSSATAWLSEVKARLDSAYDQRFDELFRDEKAQAIPKMFFDALDESGKKAEVDVTAGTSTYNEAINIGDMKLLVENSPKHLQYIKDSPVLSKFIADGYLSAPLVLNLKEQGNVLVNIDEENYSESVEQFINQLIVQFLLSFPASRINFCLIDIDNKMDFSKFKSLTRINNNILFGGIIRDDRQLENTVKDMEQVMYKVNDDILSYNNVEDIYEYNKKFQANPQNVHLFVLVNYPTGMRDDIAKRVLKIVQSGNKAGIFSIIVNNKSCQLSPGYKPTEYSQFIENAKKCSLVINANNNRFGLDLPLQNYFVAKGDIYVRALSSIIEMLKDNAENNRQVVVPLSRMFEEIDAMAKSSKGIPSSAEVLDIPIGARGGEIQNILLKTTGDGSAHAVLIGGTGSGKSNLLHTIIMSACYKYSPEELNLYLVDFKGGVEFKFYEANKVREKQMPHIKLTGLTSELDDGVAILNNLHKELRRREDEFRRCRVEDIVQYRNLGKSIPRLFVIIDEIQELFEQDDKLGQKAIDILRELFKKGRAFGINILWASQNIPKAPGLRDKVLSQIGNRISLRLNEPDDAIDIKIDPKVVKNLNRPEKGLGVINDIRYGNDSVEFRVAYAETSENRQKYAQEIIDKWSKVAAATHQEPLFIVGDDDEPSPVEGKTIYNYTPKHEDIVSKSFESYILQLGQDYVTGKPFDVNIALRADKANLLLAGYDVEILRDMMGYSLLSLVLNQKTNIDCINEGTKIYYANGEMINPKNSNDLFNILRTDFNSIIENASSSEQFIATIKYLYTTYKTRSLKADNSEIAEAYTPYFFVIHSMQRYVDLFNSNPMLQLREVMTDSDVMKEVAATSTINTGLAAAKALFGEAKATANPSPVQAKSKMPDTIFFSDAVKELLDRGGKFGIHFVISIDNPLGIATLKNEMTDIMYKVFVKGINVNVISQILGDYKAASSLNNPKVALVAVHDERTKIRVYRYEDEQDSQWYKKLRDDYLALR